MLSVLKFVFLICEAGMETHTDLKNGMETKGVVG